MVRSVDFVVDNVPEMVCQMESERERERVCLAEHKSHSHGWSPPHLFSIVLSDLQRLCQAATKKRISVNDRFEVFSSRSCSVPKPVLTF